MAVSLQVKQIANSAEEQTARLTEINSDMLDISDVIGLACNTAEASAVEANGLGKLSTDLQEEIKAFSTERTKFIILDQAKYDHRLFVNKVKAAIQGTLRMSSAEVTGHHECRFGKWYDTLGSQLCGHLPSFTAISVPHEKIHLLSKEALSAAERGDAATAQAKIAGVEQLSQQVIDLLDSLKRECTG